LLKEKRLKHQKKKTLQPLDLERIGANQSRAAVQNPNAAKLLQQSARRVLALTCSSRLCREGWSCRNCNILGGLLAHKRGHSCELPNPAAATQIHLCQSNYSCFARDLAKMQAGIWHYSLLVKVVLEVLERWAIV